VITIAVIQRRHIRGFYAVLDSVSREKKFLAWTSAPPFRSVKEFVLNSIARGNPQVVALDDGKVVGWCDITRHPRDTTRHCGTLGMGLLPAYRGKGIGTHLMHTALLSAKKGGLYRVELEVFEDNAAARALYEKAGFAVEGKKIGAVKIDDRYVNTFIMGILLQDYSGARPIA